MLLLFPHLPRELVPELVCVWLWVLQINVMWLDLTCGGSNTVSLGVVDLLSGILCSKALRWIMCKVDCGSSIHTELKQRSIREIVSLLILPEPVLCYPDTHICLFVCLLPFSSALLHRQQGQALSFLQIKCSSITPTDVCEGKIKKFDLQGQNYARGLSNYQFLQQQWGWILKTWLSP